MVELAEEGNLTDDRIERKVNAYRRYLRVLKHIQHDESAFNDSVETLVFIYDDTAQIHANGSDRVHFLATIEFHNQAICLRVRRAVAGVSSVSQESIFACTVVLTDFTDDDRMLEQVFHQFGEKIQSAFDREEQITLQRQKSGL